MKMRRITQAGVTTTAVLLLELNTAAAVHLGASAGIPQPILLRLTGFIDSAPQGERTLGTVTLGADRTVTTLELSAVQTLNGPLTEGPSALRQVEQYRPNLLLIGDQTLLESIRAAPPHTKITVFGYIRGPHRLIVVDVQTG